MITKIKGAIFDLDGTLVDSLIVWDIIWETLGKKYFSDISFRPSDEDDKAVRTMTLSEAMSFIHNKYQIAESGEELLEEVNVVLRNFYTKDVKLKSGVMRFLKELYEQNIRMCIASASDKEMIKLAIEHTGIDYFFSDIFSCADINKGKDEPDIYLLAMEQLGCTSQEICVFEDSLVAIQTAKKIGMKTVGIYDKFNYGQEQIKQMADVYISEDETLEKIIS